MLIGRLTRDPELRYIPSTGNAVARFSLAIDRGLSREKKQELEARGQQTADFINIVVWGKQAENCANYLQKGLLTAVQGRIQSNSYEDKDGNRRYSVEVVANRVEFLEWNNNRNNNSNFGGGYNNNNNDEVDFPGVDGFEPIDDDNIPF